VPAATTRARITHTLNPIADLIFLENIVSSWS